MFKFAGCLLRHTTGINAEKFLKKIVQTLDFGKKPRLRLKKVRDFSGAQRRKAVCPRSRTWDKNQKTGMIIG